MKVINKLRPLRSAKNIPMELLERDGNAVNELTQWGIYIKGLFCDDSSSFEPGYDDLNTEMTIEEVQLANDNIKTG